MAPLNKVFENIPTDYYVWYDTVWVRLTLFESVLSTSDIAQVAGDEWPISVMRDLTYCWQDKSPPDLRHYKFVIKVLYGSMVLYAEWLYRSASFFLGCICFQLALSCYIDIAALQIPLMLNVMSYYMFLWEYFYNFKTVAVFPLTVIFTKMKPVVLI